jgi:uncharacterized protein YodC (DUF2158 family)
MDTSFKVGDLVQLKSGGPRMVVSSMGESMATGKMRIWCEWFVKDSKGQDTKKSDEFTPETLQHFT